MSPEHKVIDRFSKHLVKLFKQEVNIINIFQFLSEETL